MRTGYHRFPFVGARAFKHKCCNRKTAIAGHSIACRPPRLNSPQWKETLNFGQWRNVDLPALLPESYFSVMPNQRAALWIARQHRPTNTEFEKT
jgi:hypothetical protein